MTSSQPKQKGRGSIQFRSDDHELFRLVQKRVDQKWSWEQIAAEIGCEVDPLLHWVNHGYQFPQKPAVRSPVAGVLKTTTSTEDMPKDSPATMSKQFLAWKKARDGAAAQREKMRKRA